jgi:hypothetical protein
MQRVLIVLLFFIPSMPAVAQTQPFTRDGLDYKLDLPSASWRVVSRLDVHDHVEFVYGDDYSNGYLRLRKKFVNAGATATDLFSHDEIWELRRLPGYVVCNDGSGEDFGGQLKGTAFSYEYINKGKNMDGRIYYLQVDNRTFYVLHFTVASDQLQRVRSQMDSIVKSFRLK